MNKELALRVLSRALLDLLNYCSLLNPEYISQLTKIQNQCPSKALANEFSWHYKDAKDILDFWDIKNVYFQTYCFYANICPTRLHNKVEEYIVREFKAWPSKNHLSITFNVNKDIWGMSKSLAFQNLLESLIYLSNSDGISWSKKENDTFHAQIDYLLLEDFKLNTSFLNNSSLHFVSSLLENVETKLKTKTSIKDYNHDCLYYGIAEENQDSLYYFAEYSKETSKKNPKSRGPSIYKKYLLAIVNITTKSITILDDVGKLAKTIYSLYEVEKQKLEDILEASETYGEIIGILRKLEEGVLE